MLILSSCLVLPLSLDTGPECARCCISLLSESEKGKERKKTTREKEKIFIDVSLEKDSETESQHITVSFELKQTERQIVSWFN